MLCKNHNKGAFTRKECKVGCIGCMKCTKVCESDAIRVENNTAHVDYDKCIACGKCVSECPVGAIHLLTLADGVTASSGRIKNRRIQTEAGGKVPSGFFWLSNIQPYAPRPRRTAAKPALSAAAATAAVVVVREGAAVAATVAREQMMRITRIRRPLLPHPQKFIDAPPFLGG